MVLVGNIAKELRHIRRRTGLSMDAFAQRLGYRSASGYQRYEEEGTYADGKVLPNRIAKKIIDNVVVKKLGDPPIRSEEILALAGLVVQHPPRRGVIDSQPSRAQHDRREIARIIEIEMRPGTGGAGFGDVVNDTGVDGITLSVDEARGEWGVPAYYLRELGVSKDGLYFFRNIGDSMTNPDGTGIHSGDLLLADTKDRLPSPPGIFALWDGFGTIVKRVEYVMNSDPPSLKIMSDNPRHDSFERVAEEVNIVGRCVWFGRPL